MCCLLSLTLFIGCSSLPLIFIVFSCTGNKQGGQNGKPELDAISANETSKTGSVPQKSRSEKQKKSQTASAKQSTSKQSSPDKQLNQPVSGRDASTQRTQASSHYSSTPGDPTQAVTKASAATEKGAADMSETKKGPPQSKYYDNTSKKTTCESKKAAADMSEMKRGQQSKMSTLSKAATKTAPQCSGHVSLHDTQIIKQLQKLKGDDQESSRADYYQSEAKAAAKAN